MAPKTGTRTDDKPSRGKLQKKLAAAETTIAGLTDEVAILTDRVRELEVEAARWRRKARKQRSRVEKLRAAAEAAVAEASTLARKRARQRADVRLEQVIADHPRAEPLALRGAPALPQPTWTVPQLRQAAREQGVEGYTTMRKAELLDALV